MLKIHVELRTMTRDERIEKQLMRLRPSTREKILRLAYWLIGRLELRPFAVTYDANYLWPGELKQARKQVRLLVRAIRRREKYWLISKQRAQGGETVSRRPHKPKVRVRLPALQPIRTRRRHG